MYHFVDLSDAQKHQRRHLLDTYAFIAQLSAIAPLLAIQAIFLLQYFQRRATQGSYFPTGAIPVSQDDPSDTPPSSPHAKYEDVNGHGRLVSRLNTTWRKFSWWCGEEVTWTESTRGELLAAAGWSAWLVLLCFLQTGNDYLHLTKRFGLVAASQLPLHYLLPVKTPHSPLQYFTRRSHESLVAIHQLLGRVIIALFAVHAALYTNFFILSSLLATKLTQLYILAGYFAICSLIVLGTTALAWVRKRNYRLFHTAHVVLSCVIIPALWIHVSHIRIYLYETLAIYAINQVLRAWATRTHTARITHVPGTRNLVQISFLGSEGTDIDASKALASWQVGHHGYISTETRALRWPWSRGNPFTLACVPGLASPSNGHEASSATASNLTFVARVLAGETQMLQNAPGQDYSIRNLSLEGPYGLTAHADRLLSYDRVLFVAGGIGGTFCVPLYMQLLADLSPSPGSHRRGKVAFLWVVRSLAEIGWAIPSGTSETADFVERLKVCVTGTLSREDDSWFVADTRTGADHGRRSVSRKTSHGRKDVESYAESGNAPDEDRDGIELEEQKSPSKPVTASDGAPPRRKRSTTTTILKTPGLTVHSGRPEIGKSVEQVFARSASERVAVVVCGPKSLCKSIRTEVARFVHRGRDVWFWEERFAL